MANFPHDFDHDTPFNFNQSCPCGIVSPLSPLACFLHTSSPHEQSSRNLWIVLVTTFLVYLGWSLFL
ncbi:hypothetical protein [Candidatus Finniella inopinata]|uniref:Uncharacterized protein n=1 Tax=Candidatus Finniella inopinata TaxID=1696036 RepID=A0A4Q7DGQ1_9PROT|nr:hypothetical protein [Candidatus Finniella inopinata]RZI45450.1 hypothetical protein EQU50_07115 [Candidatus Finniella inopinata]